MASSTTTSPVRDFSGLDNAALAGALTVFLYLLRAICFARFCSALASSSQMVCSLGVRTSHLARAALYSIAALFNAPASAATRVCLFSSAVAIVAGSVVACVEIVAAMPTMPTVVNSAIDIAVESVDMFVSSGRLPEMQTTDTEQPNQPNDDQINRDNIVEQFRDNEYENTGDQ